MNIQELNQLLDSTDSNEFNDFKDDAYLVREFLQEIKNEKND
jgi:hypothetical protein